MNMGKTFPQNTVIAHGTLKMFAKMRFRNILLLIER